MTTDEVIAQRLSNPLTDGLTLSGGEPFAQSADCLTIARAAHEHGLNVLAYTGWTYEHLLRDGNEAQKALLNEVDVLVDGPFLLSERSLDLPWRGSKNQRVITLNEVQCNGNETDN